MEKIVIAVDSFKGTMTSLEAGNAIAAGIRDVWPDAEICVVPVADGGEGTTEALTYGKVGVMTHRIRVTGPLGLPVEAEYVSYDDPAGRIALIEMAQAAGLPLVPEHDRNPLHTTTYGVGELIRSALDEGCRHFIVGIGGSSTNDGGVGMLQALGYGFVDDTGRPVGYGAEGLSGLSDIYFEDVDRRLSRCSFRVACDVTNPLLGANGCSAVFAPQKGADAAMVLKLENYIKRYADIVEHIAGCDMGEIKSTGNRNTPGAGAAGGLGYAFVMFLHGELKSGADIVMEQIGLAEKMTDADLVITGEGRMDAQTLMGKIPACVAELAHSRGIRTVNISGCHGDGADICKTGGLFDACYSVDEMCKSEASAADKLRGCARTTARMELLQILPQCNKILIKQR